MQEEINGRIVKVLAVDNLTGNVLAVFSADDPDTSLIRCRLPEMMPGDIFEATGEWKAAARPGSPQVFKASDARILKAEQSPSPTMR